jgi:hypothetical protein
MARLQWPPRGRDPVRPHGLAPRQATIISAPRARNVQTQATSFLADEAQPAIVCRCAAAPPLHSYPGGRYPAAARS